jgi:hypothetical protein
MLDSRLFEHIKVLNSLESANFLRFAQAMIDFEKDIPNETYLLLKYFFKHINNEKKLSKEVAYAAIYPNETWKSVRIEKLMSYALRLFKKYIIFKQGNEADEDFIQNLGMSTFYKEHKMHKLFELNAKQLVKYKESSDIKKENHYYNIYLIENQIYEYKNEFNTRKENLNLPETIFALDSFYLIKRLDFSLTSLIQNQYIPFDSDKSILGTLDYVIALASHPAYIGNNLVQLYLKAIQLQIEDRCDIIFDSFANSLEREREQINPISFALFCTVARNYCTRQYNKGRNEFLKTLFTLFQKHLSYGVLYSEGGIRAAAMQNIVMTSLKLGEYEFVKSFLLEHEHKIIGTLQADLVWKYNFATYYFEVKEFEKANQFMPNYLDLHDTYYSLSARRLEIKILYEMDINPKHDTLGYKIDAYKNFLFESKKNKRISEPIFNMNNDFIDLLKQIRTTIPKDSKRVEKLTFKLEEIASVAEREWLLEKLEKMK